MELLTEQVAFINAQVIPWMLRLVMLGLGLSLTVEDFRRVFRFPKAAAVGLTTQIVGLPIAALLLVLLFDPAPAVAVGLIILALCPSGVTSNAYTFAARADVPLSVTLTAITSVITVFTIPFFTSLALEMFMDQSAGPDLPVLGMLQTLLTLTLFPVLLGMVIRFLWPKFAEKADEPLRKAVLILLFVVLGLGVLSSLNVIRTEIVSVGFLALVMNVGTMALGYGLSRLFRLPIAQVVTITFEVGVQNLALALAITFNILQNPDLAVAALVYAVIMPATSLAFVRVGRKMIDAETLTPK